MNIDNSQTPAWQPQGEHHTDRVQALYQSEARWLPASPVSSRRRLLSAVLRNWLKTESRARQEGTLSMSKTYTSAFGMTGMGAILEDLWAADRHLQPDFDVAVLSTEQTNKDPLPGQILAVVTGSARRDLNGYYIQGLAVDPLLHGDAASFLLAANLLVEAVIDVSLEVGLRGWVISDSTEVNAVIWRALGFSRQSGPFVRRMGYFDQPPVKRPN